MLEAAKISPAGEPLFLAIVWEMSSGAMDSLYGNALHRLFNSLLRRVPPLHWGVRALRSITGNASHDEQHIGLVLINMEKIDAWILESFLDWTSSFRSIAL